MNINRCGIVFKLYSVKSLLSMGHYNDIMKCSGVILSNSFSTAMENRSQLWVSG